MAKKKKIIKKTPTRVHSFRCTDKDWKELKKLAKECGMSIGKYLVETGKKHHPRQRLTPEESKALNSLTEARTDLIKVRSKLHDASPEEKQKMFRSIVKSQLFCSGDNLIGFANDEIIVLPE